MAIFRLCVPASAFCAVHSLAETYSTLTRLPFPHRATAAEAALFLDSVCERLSLIGLDTREYRDALHEASAQGIVGGAVYDFLIAACALKAGANALYTWNLRHYSRFGLGLPEIVRSPA